MSFMSLMSLMSFISFMTSFAGTFTSFMAALRGGTALAQRAAAQATRALVLSRTVRRSSKAFEGLRNCAHTEMFEYTKFTKYELCNLFIL